MWSDKRGGGKGYILHGQNVISFPEMFCRRPLKTINSHSLRYASVMKQNQYELSISIFPGNFQSNCPFKQLLVTYSERVHNKPSILKTRKASKD